LCFGWFHHNVNVILEFIEFLEFCLGDTLHYVTNVN